MCEIHLIQWSRSIVISIQWLRLYRKQKFPPNMAVSPLLSQYLTSVSDLPPHLPSVYPPSLSISLPTLSISLFLSVLLLDFFWKSQLLPSSQPSSELTPLFKSELTQSLHQSLHRSTLTIVHSGSTSLHFGCWVSSSLWHWVSLSAAGLVHHSGSTSLCQLG